MSPPAMATTADGAHVAATETKVDDVPLMDHAYDGIREYDNPLPGWWRGVFWATIVFSAGYWVWFHIGGWGTAPEAKYQLALDQYAADKGTREKAELRDISEDTFVRNANDPKLLAQGQAIFASRCVSCHAAEGQGVIGPNLTDRYQ